MGLKIDQWTVSIEHSIYQHLIRSTFFLQLARSRLIRLICYVNSMNLDKAHPRFEHTLKRGDV